MEDWEFGIYAGLPLSTHRLWPPIFLPILMVTRIFTSYLINTCSLALLGQAFQLVNHLKTLLTLLGGFGVAGRRESPQS